MTGHRVPTACPQCGAGASHSPSFCGYCGYAFAHARRWNAPLVVSLVCATVAIGVLAVAWFATRPSEPDRVASLTPQLESTTVAVRQPDEDAAAVTVPIAPPSAPATSQAPAPATSAVVTVALPPPVPTAVPLPVPTRAPPAPAPEYVPEPMDGSLHRGHKGERTRHVQILLHVLCYPVDDDGFFGPGTERAVVDYQRSNGLEVDGWVGPNTMSLLILDAEYAINEELGCEEQG